MRYILSVIGVIILTILAVIFVVGRNTNEPAQISRTNGGNIVLTDYINKDSAVISSAEGPITAPETHYSVAISVSRNTRKVVVFRGYDGEVINEKSYPNTQNSYDAFINAIHGAGYTKTRNIPASLNEAAVCPTGTHFSYEVYEVSTQVFRSWGDSCFANEGTMAGNSGLVHDLFTLQIPDYEEITSGINY